MNRNTKVVPSLSALMLGLALSGPAVAQSALTETAPGTETQQTTLPEQAAQPTEQATEQSLGQTDLSSTAIIRELAPFQGGNPGARVTVETPRGVVVTNAARAVDLTVFFAYDSARLLPEALAQLDALGNALNSSELRGHQFLIAGHTDARGSAAYNRDLSVRRAISVAEYLVRYHRIAPGRLVAHGWGESRLRVPSDPGSGANRRVEVSLIVEQNSSVWPHFEYHPWERDFATGLGDPRWRLSAYALDDFGATPSFPKHWSY